MRPCILLILPEALARHVLQEWLTWKYVVLLDSAFCSREARKKLFGVAYEPQTTMEMHPQYIYSNFRSILVWALSRGVRLDRFRIYNDCCRGDEVLQAFLSKCGAEVRWIECSSLHTSVLNCKEVLLDAARFCPRVRSLVLRDCSRGIRSDWGHCLGELTQAFPGLIELSLSEVLLTKQGLAEALTKSKALERFSVSNRDQVIPVEIAIPSLRSIVLYTQYISDDVLVAIGLSCARLEKFHLFAGLQFPALQASDVGIQAVLQGCPLLCDTDVVGAAGFGLEVRVELVRRRNFTVLDMGLWRDMNDGLLRHVLRVSPNLTELRGKRMNWLSDATLEVCGQYCPLLTTLQLWDCPEVTNEGMQALVSGLAGKLRSVFLRECPGLCSPAVLAIAEHCPLLEQLICPQRVSAAALLKLAERCPHLTKLDASGSNIRDVMKTIFQLCPKLDMMSGGGGRRTNSVTAAVVD
jgi:hypothetical protein